MIGGLHEWNRRVLAEAGVWPPPEVEDIDITDDWRTYPGRDYTVTYSSPTRRGPAGLTYKDAHSRRDLT